MGVVAMWICLLNYGMETMLMMLKVSSHSLHNFLDLVRRHESKCTHLLERHRGKACNKLNHTQDAVTFGSGELISCWWGYLGRRGGEEAWVGWKHSQARSETEAREEWHRGEGDRQLGKGVAVPSPEANEGGLNVEERQDVIMTVFRWRDLVLREYLSCLLAEKVVKISWGKQY